MITANARKNVDFHADVLSLRRRAHLRPHLDRLLTPLTNPRNGQRAER
jgi:hypothetical protein